MKIRNGFVSNSSSSSFLIYGCEITSDHLDIISSKLNVKVDDMVDDYIGDYIYQLLKNNKNLESFSCCDGEVNYIGKSWSEVGDNQTGKEFKTNIENSIKSLMGIEIPCGTHEGDS